MPTADLATLDWDHVRVFLAVAREGQLARAAARLGLDVSTVSRRIDRLEAELGVHLFDRTRDGTQPTAAAEAMLVAAETMAHGLAQLAAAVDAVETTAEGVVRLAAPPGISDAFVGPSLARFHQRFPRVVVELEVSVAYADLTRREANLALRTQRPRSGDLIAVKIAAPRELAMTSPEYAAELGTLRRWRDARWVTWGDDLMQLPSARWLSRQLAGATPVLRTSHFATQLAAAAGGLGVVLAVEPFRHVHRLVPVALSRALRASLAELPDAELWLVGHRAMRHVPRVAALWDFLVELFTDPAKLVELANRPGRRAE